MRPSSVYTSLDCAADSGSGAVNGAAIDTSFIDKATVSVTVYANTGSQIVTVQGNVGTGAYGTIEDLTFATSTGTATKFSQITSPFDNLRVVVASKGSSGSTILGTVKLMGDPV